MPPPLPALQDVFPDLTGMPVLQGEASDLPITLASRHVSAIGDGLNGIREVRLHSARVMSELRTGPATSITTSPGFLQRTLDGMTERALTFDVPAVVWQWAAQRDTTLRLEWVTDLSDTLGPAQWSSGDRWLFAVADDQHNAALFCFDRNVDWQVEQFGSALHLRATTQIPNGEHVSFAVFGGHNDSKLFERAARALDRLAPLVRGRVGAAQRVERERLRVSTPEPALNEAWRWALHRLEGGQVGADPVWAALALLALGDFAAVRDILAFQGEPDHQTEPDATPLYLLLMARYLASSADLDFVRGEWTRVRSAANLNRDTDIWAAALRELAIAAEGIGQREDQGRFRAEAERGRGSEGFNELLTWLDRAADHDLTDDSAVRTILPFVFGVLGLEPDAPRNRVTLRPAIPYGWQFMTVDNLRVGEARFSLRYAREGSQHTFGLVPTSGSVPLRVIFEPRIRADRIEHVLIDGQPAELDVRRSSDHLVCPMQVVLDCERSVVIEAG